MTTQKRIETDEPQYVERCFPGIFDGHLFEWATYQAEVPTSGNEIIDRKKEENKRVIKAFAVQVDFYGAEYISKILLNDNSYLSRNLSTGRAKK
jgi:hypothetical protein